MQTHDEMRLYVREIIENELAANRQSIRACEQRLKGGESTTARNRLNDKYFTHEACVQPNYEMLHRKICLSVDKKLDSEDSPFSPIGAEVVRVLVHRSCIPYVQKISGRNSMLIPGHYKMTAREGELEILDRFDKYYSEEQSNWLA